MCYKKYFQLPMAIENLGKLSSGRKGHNISLFNSVSKEDKSISHQQLLKEGKRAEKECRIHTGVNFSAFTV